VIERLNAFAFDSTFDDMSDGGTNRKELDCTDVSNNTREASELTRHTNYILYMCICARGGVGMNGEGSGMSVDGTVVS